MFGARNPICVEEYLSPKGDKKVEITERMLENFNITRGKHSVRE
jgi:hypothetical protein